MDSLSSLPATTQPAITSADPEASSGAPVTVASKIAGTDTVTVAAGDTRNEMPDRAPGKDGPGDSISEKTVKETRTDTQMSQKGADDVEKTGSEDAAAAVSSEGANERGPLKSVTDKVQTIQTSDDSEAEEVAEESPKLARSESFESAGDDKDVDESSETEAAETTASDKKEEEKEES